MLGQNVAKNFACFILGQHVTKGWRHCVAAGGRGGGVGVCVDRTPLHLSPAARHLKQVSRSQRDDRKSQGNERRGGVVWWWWSYTT